MQITLHIVLLIKLRYIITKNVTNTAKKNSFSVIRIVKKIWEIILN